HTQSKIMAPELWVAVGCAAAKQCFFRRGPNQNETSSTSNADSRRRVAVDRRSRQRGHGAVYQSAGRPHMSRPISIDGYWRGACAGKKTKSDRRYFRWGGRVLIVPVGAIIIWAMGLALVWLLDELFSILTFLSTASILLAFLVVLPLAMPKPTRAFSSAALGIFSYLFGATLLADSVLVDAAAWRGVAVIVGGVFGFGV